MNIDNDDDDDEDDEKSGVPPIHLQVALVPTQVNVITKAVFASPSFVTFPCLRLFSWLFAMVGKIVLHMSLQTKLL